MAAGTGSRVFVKDAAFLREPHRLDPAGTSHSSGIEQRTGVHLEDGRILPITGCVATGVMPASARYRVTTYGVFHSGRRYANAIRRQHSLVGRRWSWEGALSAQRSLLR